MGNPVLLKLANASGVNRLSVGIEDVDDLIEDLNLAITAASMQSEKRILALGSGRYRER